MKVLVTGASGYVGGGIVRATQAAGHEVYGLVRDQSTRLPDGVLPVRGDLADAASLAGAAEMVDGVVHAASPNDETQAGLDRFAAEAMLTALAGSDRFFVHTSGAWVLGDTGGRIAGEDDPLDPPAMVAWRPDVERLVRDAAASGVRSVIVRPAVAYGRGGGYIPLLLAPHDGVVRYLGDGSNHWTTVHVDDLGELYRLAAESAAAGSTYNAAADVVRAVDAARTVADAAGARVEPWPRAEAEQQWGPAVETFLLDQVVSGDRAHRELGWTPRQPGLLDELRRQFGVAQAS